MLKCGMYEVDMTPPLGLCIPGYFNERRATGIKDELYAKAAVFEDGEESIAFVSLDLLHPDKDVSEKVRRRISEITGIKVENIMVSATHCHTGAPTLSRFGGEEERAYTEHMCRKASDAAVIAFNKRVPVKIGFGVGSERDISFNRRYFMKNGTLLTNPGVKNPDIDRPAGPIDPEVTVVRIDDMSGTPIGVITNFACHPDVVGGKEYSADYPGQLSADLKAVLGRQVVSLFFTGACGNINHIDTSGKREKSSTHYKWMGRILAGEVLKVREKIQFEEEVSIKVENRSFVTPLRKPVQEEIEKAQAVMADSGASEVEKVLAGYILNFDYEAAKPVEVEQQAFRIGSLGIVGLPGEIFVEFGLDIKKQSPMNYTMVNTLANRSFAYITTREAVKQGGYEARITRNLKLPPEAGYRMVEYSVEMLNKLAGS